MPSFNGSFIFGRSPQFVTAENPREDQRIAAPGVSGVASLDLGDRGAVTTVAGLLVGTTAANLNLAEAAFRALRDGGAYVLVDNFGNAWSYVKMIRFTPRGTVRLDLKWGYHREYEAEFHHLLGLI